MNKSKQGETMTYAVAINQNGQATIPKTVREDLNITPGENRLIIARSKSGRYYLAREASAREQLMASMQRIWARNAEEERKNPAIAAAKAKYKNMTYEEIMDDYYNTEEGKKEFKEKYGIEL